MKLAICGQGPAAIEAALYFNRQGASVVLHTPEPEGSLWKGLEILGMGKFPMPASWREITSERARALLSNFSHSLSEVPSVEDYLNHYLRPLVDFLTSERLIDRGHVLRIHKRFLPWQGELAGSARLKDLFRVVIKVDPRDAELFDQEELKEKVSLEVLNELRREHEFFGDYDLVLEMPSEVFGAKTLGPSGALALNESFYREAIVYGLPSLSQWERLQKAKDILIVGDGLNAALVFLALAPWMAKEGNCLHLVTSHQQAFAGLEQSSWSEQLHLFLSQQMGLWQNKCEDYTQSLRRWRDLAQDEKLKPKAPKQNIIFYEGFNITALDKLSDQKGLFATLESPSFRQHGQDILKTLSVDEIISFNDEDLMSSCYPRLAHEPGYYDLVKLSQTALGPALDSFFDKVFADVCQYFTKA